MQTAILSQLITSWRLLVSQLTPLTTALLNFDAPVPWSGQEALRRPSTALVAGDREHLPRVWPPLPPPPATRPWVLRVDGEGIRHSGGAQQNGGREKYR